MASEDTSLPGRDPKNPWLALAQEAYSESTSYMDNNYRTIWEDGIDHFRSTHTSDSKFLKTHYKYRSKVFRPKTRSAIRSNEAAAMAAFFSNQDVISCDPQDMNNPEQAASAALMDAVINYRLTTTIPWFQIVLGGVQDAQVVGVVCSYQYWDYREESDKYEYTWTDVDGKERKEELDQTRVVRDQPCIELLPVENLRIHPAADWMDPINSSPYLIRLVPLHAYEVMDRMRENNPKTGQPKWKKYKLEEIRQSQTYENDTTRLARENREDSYETENAEDLKEFEIIWCHENFIRRKGVDYVFWTLGTQFMLTDPVPIDEIYWTGERPFVMGCCIIETHKIYPSGVAELGKPLQKELNENANQRLDNIKLVMNKRYIGRRGANIDFDSLLRNVAGSVTLADDVVGDIRELEFNDVTSSAYMEQDRLNLDFDELVGNFSPSSVQSNRKMNETVRGMAMVQGSANNITEYLLRTISETWLEPVMRQLVKLEQAYETDEVVLAIAADKAKLWQKYGVDKATDSLLKHDLTVRVNVGMGATDPMMRVQNFMMGINALSMLVKEVPPGMFNLQEIGKEIFGRMGYRDGERFLSNQEQQDPQKMQMAQALQQAGQIIQQLQAKAEDKQADRQVKLIDTQMREAGQDRRKAADIKASIIEKQMDLMNPVSGERKITQ